jgi:hypothetical protein
MSPAASPTKFAALHGLIDQLPRSGSWTPDRRQAWVDALLVVLDYTVPIRQLRPDEVEEAEP